MSIDKVKKAQAAYLAALHELADGQTLPDEVVKNQTQISNAMGIGSSVEATSKALEDKNAALEAEVKRLKNEAAPLRNQAGNGQAGSNPKPGEGTTDPWERAAKALSLGGTIRDGKLKNGTGDLLPVSGPDLMGLYMEVNGLALNWPQQRSRPEITHSENIARLLELA